MEQVKILKGCFDGFSDEDGAIPADNVGSILSMMGMKFKPSALKEIIEEIDEDGMEFNIKTFVCDYSFKVLDCLSLENSVNWLPSSLLRRTMKH